MRPRWPVVLLLVSGLVLLASLYLPWQQPEDGSAALSVVDLSGRRLDIEGWSSELGTAAGVFGATLVAAAVAAVVQPRLAGRVPLARLALLTGYGAIAVAVETRYEARAYHSLESAGLRFHFAYGAYMGLGAGLAAALGALALRRKPAGYVVTALASGLLAALLLPWVRLASHVSAPAFVSATAAVAIAATVWAPAARLRLAAAAAALVLTGGTLRSLGQTGGLRYGAWLALAFAVALFTVSLGQTWALGRRPRYLVPRLPEVAAALFLLALFLPWQEVCAPGVRCYSTAGWTLPGSAAAALAVAAVALASFDVIAGFALFVATQGFQVANFAQYPGVRVGYGAIVGFAAAAAMVVVALRRLRPRALPRDRLAPALPVAACAAYIAVVVVPWWDVLPGGPFRAPVLRFAPLSWLTIAGVVVAIRLTGAWVRRFAQSGGAADLVFLPLGLLALAALDLIRLREGGITWGGGIVVGLCLLLAALGRLEQRGRLRVPELLRFDRL